MSHLITLDNLRVGQKAKVCSVLTKNSALRRRIMDMGITRGVVVEVIKIAPLGDPVAISVRGYTLSVRKSDLALIEGEVISTKEINNNKDNEK